MLNIRPCVEESCRKPFVENVCKLVTARYVWNSNLAESHFFPNEVNVELDMLGALVLVVYQLLARVDGRHIVSSEDNCGLGHGQEQLTEEMTQQPGALGYCIRDAPVFRSALDRDTVCLLFEGP